MELTVFCFEDAVIACLCCLDFEWSFMESTVNPFFPPENPSLFQLDFEELEA
jgi:hypothetical protein